MFKSRPEDVSQGWEYACYHKGEGNEEKQAEREIPLFKYGIEYTELRDIYVPTLRIKRNDAHS